MPELPEVENIAAGLRTELQGHTVAAIVIRQPIILKGTLARNWRRPLARWREVRLTDILRRGKRLILVGEHNAALLVQLGMTGKFLFAPPANLPRRHNHFYLDFHSGKTLYYYDPRRFGRLWLLEHPFTPSLDAAMQRAGMSPLGPEPLAVTPGQFRRLLQSSRPIKSLLLDQTRLAGLGNIYADEALFAAAIHPLTPSRRIPPRQADSLCRAVKSVLRRAIRYGGTTFSDFRNPYGDMGRFRYRLRTYQRTGQPCPRCRTPIERLVISGRSSHFCPRCQPSPDHCSSRP